MRGGCLCGAIRYEAGGAPTHETCCHCTACRRSSAAPFVAWFTVPVAEFRITRGAPASFRSSSHAVRSFCGACGTPLTFASSRSPDEIDVTTCSLEDPEGASPKDHTHVASRLGWVELDDGLPAFPAART